MEASTKSIRRRNLNMVRSAFQKSHKLTASQLSKKTGLSVVTINALLKVMMSEGEVFESDKLITNGGRPSAEYRYNNLFMCSCIVYGFHTKGDDYVRVIVADVFKSKVFEIESVFDSIKIESFNDMIDEAFHTFATIKSITFGLPGEENDGSITINDYREIVGDAFIRHYKDRYNVPIYFVNDVNAATYGYYSQNIKELHDKNVVGLFFPKAYKPGAGLIMNGDIFRGSMNFAGEVGYMPIGIDWTTLDYNDEKSMIEAIARLVSIICCVIAPDHITLYGEFLHKSMEAEIMSEVSKYLSHAFSASLSISDEFSEHFELGLIEKAIQTLEEGHYN